MKSFELKQLPLPIQLKEPINFDTYCSGENQQIVTALQQLAVGKGERFIYLWGEEGSGRTHLMQAVCAQAGAAQLTAVYLPLTELISYTPEIVEDLHSLDIICLDDIDKIAGNAAWEEQLFYLYNQLLLHKKFLLVSAKTAPKHLNMQLPDLKSRLSSGLIYQLKSLSDADKRKVLQLHAVQRGLNLEDEVADYMLSHYSRDLTHLLTMLKELDIASLSSQRKLTIPFVKVVIEK